MFNKLEASLGEFKTSLQFELNKASNFLFRTFSHPEYMTHVATHILNALNIHHTHSIRPTPQQHTTPPPAVASSTSSPPSVAALVSKFTLHTSSLPQPQFPVAINLASATPSPVDPMPPIHYPSSHTHPSAYTSPTVAAAMDTKYAKQTANATRRYGAGGGFRGPRDISADSGIANMGSGGANNYYGGTSSAEHSSSFDSPPSASGRRMTGRPRNLEMVLSSSRHKFDVRELDDSLSDESPLAVLPKLPSSFGSGACAQQQQAPLSGLTRQTGGAATANYRKASFASLMDVPSIEEEKEFRDKTTSEKGTRGAGAAAGAASAAAVEYSPSSKNSSPISSRASWCNAGESMAQKDCSSMSVSSCESMHNRDGGGAAAVSAMSLMLDEEDDVDNCSSAVVISGDMLCEWRCHDITRKKTMFC